MDLSLTSDFDSALLNCWDDEEDESPDGSGKDTGDDNAEPSSVSGHQESHPQDSTGESASRSPNATSGTTTDSRQGNTTGSDAQPSSSLSTAIVPNRTGAASFSFARLPSFNLSLPASGNASESATPPSTSPKHTTDGGSRNDLPNQEAQNDMSNNQRQEQLAFANVPLTITAGASSSSTPANNEMQQHRAAAPAPAATIPATASKSDSQSEAASATSSSSSAPKVHQEQQQQQVQEPTQQTQPQHQLLQQLVPPPFNPMGGDGNAIAYPMYAPQYGLPNDHVPATAQPMNSASTSSSQQQHRPPLHHHVSTSSGGGSNGESSIASGSTHNHGSAASTTTMGGSTAATDASTTTSTAASTAAVSNSSLSNGQQYQSQQQHQHGQQGDQHQPQQHPQHRQQLHHLAMTSSSSCPPHLFGAGSSFNTSAPSSSPATSNLFNTGSVAMQSGQHQQPGGAEAGGVFMCGPGMAPHATLGTMENFMAMYQTQQQPASMPAFLQQTPGHPSVQVSQQQQQQQHMQQQGQQQQQGSSQPKTQVTSAGGGKNDATESAASCDSAERHTPPPPSSQPQHQQPPPTTQSKPGQGAAENPPPFFLFDAPCELRYNFLQSQRMHNIPNTNDPNSYHYGMAVNGFHPQLNAQVNPVLPLSVASGGALGSNSMLPNNAQGNVQLIDGRYKKRSGGKERNEREQRRAQKITELIEKLRISMVKGGWKVEMKSKYHTLSTCADYVQHLIKATKEKEEAVEQAKSDLTIRERKLEEDKALQESRSDPESVTSSLTASTAGSNPCSGSGSGSDKEGQPHSRNSSKKRKSIGGEDGDNTTRAEKQSRKKVRLTKVVDKSGGDDGISSTDSSSGEEGGGSGPGGKNISLDKMSSSVSDMTDSNRSSSDGTGGGNGKSSSKKRASPGGSSTEDDDTGGSSGQASSSSISSTAAVVRGGGSRERHHQHSDVVIKEKKDSKAARDRKRKHRREKTSLERDFQLDYEEVFLTSNVPQLIATPAGRIITWNDFFLRATGLTEEEAKRLTIFSIVQADELSNLFEMVAAALRNSASKASPEKRSRKASSPSIDRDKESRTSSSSSKKTSKLHKWAAITLPCISFPSGNKNDSRNAHHPNPLFMTVTLMSDEDPKKRCFHCMLTDCPGTKGDLGSITPELLAMLFTDRNNIGCETSKNSTGKTENNRASPSRKKQMVDSTSESDTTREDTTSTLV